MPITEALHNLIFTLCTIKIAMKLLAARSNGPKVFFLQSLMFTRREKNQPKLCQCVAARAGNTVMTSLRGSLSGLPTNDALKTAIADWLGIILSPV